MDTEKLPVGYAMSLVQNMEVTTGYMGMTKEQKREVLTHELIARTGGREMLPIVAMPEAERRKPRD